MGFAWHDHLANTNGNSDNETNKSHNHSYSWYDSENKKIETCITITIVRRILCVRRVVTVILIVRITVIVIVIVIVILVNTKSKSSRKSNRKNKQVGCHWAAAYGLVVRLSQVGAHLLPDNGDRPPRL